MSNLTRSLRYKTWFTSDLHFGHENIIRHCNRPWVGVTAMNQGLVDNWNAVVGEWDSVWVLGDFVWGSVSSAAQYIEQLNGELYLVPGNHDTIWSGHREPKGLKELGHLGVHVMGGFHKLNYHGFEFLACHFPYTSDSTHENPDQFAAHRPRDEGDWLLHGHVHNAWQVRDRMVNVGTDVWGWRPVDMDDIRDIIKEKS